MNTNIWLQFLKTDRLINIKVFCIGILLLSICSLSHAIQHQQRQIDTLKGLIKLPSPAPFKAYKLTGIESDGKSFFAIIDNEIVWINDKVGDYIIKDIKLNHVTLLNIKTNKKMEIPLYKEEVVLELSRK